MKQLLTVLGTIFVMALAAFMIIDPATTLEASTSGIKLWFSAVLPALFPFFVVCDLMLGLGIVQFLGVLLNPIMRAVFRLPGESGFVVAMGFTSGFPVGAVLTRQLYKQKLLSGMEAERLVSFTNNASPLFIIGVVGTSLFNNPATGYLLAVAHYLSNILVGILIGRRVPLLHFPKSTRENLFSVAWTEFIRAARHSKGPGHLLGEAIKKAILNVSIVGGFIVIFSVLTAALSKWGVIIWLASLFQLLGASYPCSIGLGVGCFEMTLGSQALAASSGSELEKLLAVSGVLAWSGLSIQAQVMSFVSGTPIRYLYYIRARLLQVLLSLSFTLVGYKLWSTSAHQVLTHIPPTSSTIPVVALDFLRAGCLGLFWSTAALLLFALLSWLRNLRFLRNVH